MEIYLALGSNIEPRLNYLVSALELLKQEFGELVCSQIYETEAYQTSKQANYYNCVVYFNSNKSASEILTICQAIETKLGRAKQRAKGESRTIDLDILLYGDEVIKLENLIIPHYDLLNRDFFLLCLLELTPQLKDPVSKRSLQISLNLIPPHLKTNPKLVSLQNRI